MLFITLLLILPISPLLECSIYIYNTEDSSGVEVYDCLYHQSTPYCRRPLDSIPLQRDSHSEVCYADGTKHSLRSARSNNVSVDTVLHKWRSSLDKAEEYAHYLRQPIDSDKGKRSLCQCINEQSFGKNCEYLLPLGTSLTDSITAKFDGTSTNLMYVGDIVCYSTLECDFGLLCLDWRDICDGVQQCMSGFDEENCDKLEFNECEDDEYRCMNGMCIPDEYFLDGQYDCMDMSDEKGPFDHAYCPLQPASVECDDRVCSPNEWSCGDGQCLTQNDRNLQQFSTDCRNRRNQFFWCERVNEDNLQTDNNGRCSKYTANTTYRINNYCAHLLMCARHSSLNQQCPCRDDRSVCIQFYQDHCSQAVLINYPNGALITPYVFQYYDITENSRFASKITLLNGTIKCRGWLQSFILDVTEIPWLTIISAELKVCTGISNRSNFDNGNHLLYYNNSRTFNNHSYHWTDVCHSAGECISAYRIKDGFVNCYRALDESQPNELVSSSCSNVRRHRFRCSTEQASCFYASALANIPILCENGVNELSKGIQMLSDSTQCTSQSKPGCSFLRHLIEASWNITLYNPTDVQKFQQSKIPFRSYCDTFQDFTSNQDENVTMCQSSWQCLPEQWQCYTGQCIDYKWVMDGQWDCHDGSDEENIFAVNFSASHPNAKRIMDSSFFEKFFSTYQKILLAKICTDAKQKECSHSSQYTELLRNNTSTAGDPSRCVAEYDQAYVFRYCAQTYIALRLQSMYSPLNSSMIGSFNFQRRCPTSKSDSGSNKDVDRNQLSSRADVTCWNGTLAPQSRCNEKDDCPSGEDEFMCGQEDFSSISYRRGKQDAARRQTKKVQLPRFPSHTNYSSNSYRNVANVSNSTPATTPLSLTLSSLFNRCNRGIPVWTHNSSSVCFCPPQYHGDQCQWHTDRLTLLFHVNYTHSPYTASTDFGIVNKFLVLLLGANQVLSTHEFHIRPATDITAPQRRTIYLHYSRSAQHLAEKRKRHFNRSSITNDRPFSIRIEAYEMQSTLLSRRFAVWQYPIYFDYLPVHRLATVLRFVQRNERDEDPCRRRPCGQNQDCHRVLNRKSQHICLCKSRFTGENCSQIDSRCASDYCSPNALCLSGYRGLVNGKEWPYCVCPLGYIGQRCALYPNKCAQNPCRNGGTCFQRSKPNEYLCECPNGYQGTSCDDPKPFVYLHLEHNLTLSHRPIVVQYMKIDFAMLSVQIVGQQVHSHIPENLNYFHSSIPVPEIVVLKRHHVQPPDIHLIFLRMDENSTNTSTSISEHNRCRPAASLFLENESRCFHSLMHDRRHTDDHHSFVHCFQRNP